MSLFGLFIEGLLSFLSPCVLPLVPLYMSYLSSDGKEVDAEGNISYKTVKVFLMTVFFVLGLSLIFFVLALSVDVIKPFIEKYENIISLIGGTIIIIFGLHEIGIIKISFINVGDRLNINLKPDGMNYLKAFVLGLLFSIVFSPCIGPMLASAIILAASEKLGSLYILVYALGLVIPFLITGLFTSYVLNFIKTKKRLFKYTMIIAGIIMLVYGGMMIKDSSNKIINIKTETRENANDNVYLPETVYYDQFGNEVVFSDYLDKYIFLNFTTTWCHYCKEEIPVFEEFAKNEDVKCFYIMSTTSSRTDLDGILNYIEENGISITVIIDDGSLEYFFRPSGYPTKYVAGKNNELLGYVSGVMNSDKLNEILETVKGY